MSLSSPPAAAPAAALARPSAGVITALFCGYLAVGLPLPVLPLFLHGQLGFSSSVVGLVIGIQFLATVLTRGYAGALTDRHGGKRSALQGAVVCTAAAALYLLAALPSLTPASSLSLIVLGRLLAGIGESQFVTGCVSWSIASVGPQRAGTSMAWTGIAMFAALSVGAPLAMLLFQHSGFAAAMAACIAAPLLGALVAALARPFHATGGLRLPFHQVIGRIWRQGLGLMLQGVGVSGLTAFASLYFAARQWDNAGWVMTAFGLGFTAVRLWLGHLPDRLGGYRVACVSLLVEALGLALIGLATSASMALAGALVTGLGCALVFPALGVEALKRVPPSNRGSAMGAFVTFLDIAYGIAGPLAGVIAGHLGYAAVYQVAAACAIGGALLVLTSRNNPV
ncbi:MAG: putative MFS-type transporter YfcJ [Stenotrophomonas maltophilia]|uniref:Putative MFS-type transporter YfcJ n=1 Tax=Stenotrophomonas maltophilia TaxID=40324 RepID=A0A7V8FJ69_STEMA|nr:MAG: putative MFS-type transporter YfcJ [Stenotrophomonas maltophilia]